MTRPSGGTFGVACGLVIAFGIGAAHAADKWTVPRTSFGDPDLEGYWSNRTVLPLERPKELGNKATYTEQELAGFIKREIAAKEAEFNSEDSVHYNPDDYALGDTQAHLVHNLNTSVIVDPKNGRLPPLTPEAQARRDSNQKWRKVHQFDSAKTRDLGERCIKWANEGPPMLPLGYNASYQIMQTEGYVVILMEYIHDVRVIPLDGRPHLDSKVRTWLGDSRGHWEGDTLVVETTNFRKDLHTDFMFEFTGTSKGLHVTERFTRTGPKRIDYRFTVEDPGTWTKPWSGVSPWESTDGPIFEYACHEGNYGLPNTLSGMRAKEREAAASGTGG